MYVPITPEANALVLKRRFSSRRMVQNTFLSPTLSFSAFLNLSFYLSVSLPDHKCLEAVGFKSGGGKDGAAIEDEGGLEHEIVDAG